MWNAPLATVGWVVSLSVAAAVAYVPCSTLLPEDGFAGGTLLQTFNVYRLWDMLIETLSLQVAAVVPPDDVTTDLIRSFKQDVGSWDKAPVVDTTADAQHAIKVASLLPFLGLVSDVKASLRGVLLRARLRPAGDCGAHRQATERGIRGFALPSQKGHHHCKICHRNCLPDVPKPTGCENVGTQCCPLSHVA